MKIAINAEHGLYTAGKRVPEYIDSAQPREWELNHRVAQELKKILLAAGYEVVTVYDETGNEDVALGVRARKVNESGADLCITIAHNAGINGGSGGGTTLFYYPSEKRKEQANALYNEIINWTKYTNNRVTPVVPSTSLFMLKRTVCPSFIIECAFMDSVTDYKMIQSTEFQHKIAMGIAYWIDENYPAEVVNKPKCDCSCCVCKMCERN